MSTIFFDKVIITSSAGNDPANLVLLGGSVGNLNAGVTTVAQGKLLPSVEPQTNLPQLVAQAYLNGSPVAASFQWDSSNPCVLAVDQNGNCTRVTNRQTLGFDSNGATNLTVQANESFIGGLAQISATALRPDGSPSGVRGTINVAIQSAAARQFAATLNSDPAANNAPSASGFYNLIS
jgi:hypothetical protein